MGRLAAATAAVLAAHLPMLDRSDPASVRESEAYQALIAEHRAAADAALRVAAHMEACRDLPMGRHAVAPEAAAAMRAAYAEFVAAEAALSGLLASRLTDDRAMLEGMAPAAGAAS